MTQPSISRLHSVNAVRKMGCWAAVPTPLIHRLMVACSASPGSPGEVTLHVMAQPPPARSPPAAVTVLLRIAKGESSLLSLFKCLIATIVIPFQYYRPRRWVLHWLPPWGSPASQSTPRETSVCGGEPAKPPQARPGAAGPLLPGLHSSSICQLDAGLWWVCFTEIIVFIALLVDHVIIIFRCKYFFYLCFLMKYEEPSATPPWQLVLQYSYRN